MMTIANQMGAADVLARHMTERQLQDCVIDAAQKLGWDKELIYHTHDSRRSTRGFPDLILVKPGAADRGPRILAVELKRLGKTPTDAQWRWIHALWDCGVGVCVWTPEHWFGGEVERVLGRREEREDVQQVRWQRAPMTIGRGGGNVSEDDYLRYSSRELDLGREGDEPSIDRQPYLCPVCLGRGMVPPGFYAAVGVNDWAAGSTADVEKCRSCDGKGVVWQPN